MHNLEKTTKNILIAQGQFARELGKKSGDLKPFLKKKALQKLQSKQKEWPHIQFKIKEGRKTQNYSVGDSQKDIQRISTGSNAFRLGSQQQWS